MSDVLYHYCSTETFRSIIESKSVWLSSLSLSNDSTEGRLAARAFARLASRESLPEKAAEQLIGELRGLEEQIDGLGFCLSEAGDLLSQWRGYAVDGTGVAIGFRKSQLQQRQREVATEPTADPVGLYKVRYSEDEHDKEIEPAYREIRRQVDAGALDWRPGRSLLDTRTEEQFWEDQRKTVSARALVSSLLMSLFPKFYQLKSGAFREEQEWRLLSHVAWPLPHSCLFRSAGNRLVPYRIFSLCDTNAKFEDASAHETSPFVEVVLGPKHTTPTQMIESFLKQQGLPHTAVRRSSATYR